MSLKVKSNGINFNVPTIENLPTERLEEDLVCVVTDENRGGVFVYREANALINNGGTIFNGWTRQYDGAVNVKWFGAAENADCSNEIISASLIGIPYIPHGTFIATATTTNSAQVLAILDNVKCDGTLAITLDAGVHNFTSPVLVTAENGEKISIIGESPIPCSIIEQVSVAGTSGNYSVTLRLNNTDGITVGDFIHTTDTIGTGVSEIHRGGWEILSVVGNNITVKNTCQMASFPTNTITSSTSYIISTVLKFNDCDGFVVYGATLGMINNIAIVGNSDEYWNSGNVSGTEKGTHGLIIGANTIALNGKTDNVNLSGLSLGHVTSGPIVTISGFDQQGIVTELNGSFYGNYVSCCNNKRRGFYASTASGIRAKHITANGNYLDGVISDIGGQCYMSSSSSACGNGSAGISASSQGSIIFDSGILKSNKNSGALAVSGGFIQNTLSVCMNNGKYGINADYNSTIYCNNSQIDSNISSGIYGQTGSSIRALNCSILNNGGFGVRADEYGKVLYTGSTLSGNTSGDLSLRNGGFVFDGTAPFAGSSYCDSLKIRNISTSKGIQLASSSGGDSFFFGFDTVGTNTYTTGYAMVNNSNGFYASDDNVKNLGRASNRWATIYAGTGTINTSDAREKTFLEIDAIEKNVAMELKGLVRKFKFNDAIEAKGADNARIHYGTSAQEVIAVFAKYGLDAMRYAMVCYDEWEEELEIVDDEGNVTQEYRPAGNRYGIRYEELIMFILGAV